MHSLQDGGVGLGQGVGHQKYITARLKGLHGGLTGGVGGGDGIHRQRVSDDEGVFRVGDQRDKLRRKGGRGAVAGHIRCGDMPDHDGVQAGVRRKGQQLAGLQLVERFVGHGQRGVAVLSGITVAGEMLERRQDAAGAQAVRGGSGHFGGGGGVRREGPRADDGVIRVRVHIGVRRKVHVEAVLL